jgi:hypothetical protein
MPSTNSADFAVSAVKSYDIAVGPGSTLGPAVFTDSARYIRVVSNADVRILVGKSPTALATSMLLPAGQIEYIAVKPGWNIAAIGAATLNVVECE